jgi:signal peptidase II
MPERSFRWLLWTLVLVGASLDQASKYVVFKMAWDARVRASGESDAQRETEAARWLYRDSDGSSYYVLVPGAFQLLGQFSKDEAPANILSPLRTWSSDKLPKVNKGALFGLGGQYNQYANGIFALVSIVAALAIIFWSTRPSTARDAALCAALGLILAGTLGNLYDRLIFDGVRDFLYFHWFEWPVFNIADCCLVCGAVLLLVQAMWNHPAKQPQESKEVALSA